MAKGHIKKDEDQEPNVSGLEFYITAFKELSTCRPVTMSVGAIPFTAILEYYRVYSVGDFDEFHWLVRQMDNEFLELEAARSKRGQKDANGESSKDNPSNIRRKGRSGHKKDR